MKITDLTRPFSAENDCLWQVTSEDVPLKSQNTEYTGVIFKLNCESMCGSYIDFPGHIRETDDGMDACSVPLERFWRMPALAIHLDRSTTPGEVTAGELRSASGTAADAPHPAIVINALGSKNVWEFENQRGTWLSADAVEWIISCGCRLLISDIYESPRLDGVFKRLFAAGVSTVCLPRGLARIGHSPIISVLFPAVPGMTQIPCRIIAEE